MAKKTYKLVSLLTEYTAEQAYTVEIEESCSIDGYLIVTYSEEAMGCGPDASSSMRAKMHHALRSFRDTLVKELGTTKILVVPDFVKFARFVEVPEDNDE